MTDYEKATGSGGRMVIRDTGTTVQFLIEAGFTTTFKNDMGYGWTVNGSSGSGSADYPTGAPLLLLKTFTVTTSQTVTFTLDATGTSGLGGPTTFNQAITRNSGGMWIKVSGAWKKATIYVKVSGTWKKAVNIYVKVNGAWKKTTY